MDEWTKRVKEKFENAPCIEEVLFGHSFAPYALKRLQYFALTHGIMLVFLLIEFRILLEMLGAKDFGFYFFLKAGLLFFSGFWWGGLEPFRAEVRELFRLRQSYKIPRVHRRWQAFPDALMGASLCAVAVMAMAFVVLGKPFSFVAILCLIGGISFALNLKVRWLHSGIYAVRRVYLSPWALVLSRAVLPILILGLHPVMGKWCLPLALLVAEVVQVTIQLSFIRKSYQNLRLDYPGFLKFPKAWAGWRQAFFLLKNEEFRWAGLSQGLTRLDFAVVGFVFLFLALKGAGDQVEESLRLAILVAPFLVVCSEWGRLFYFDFKKLEIDSLQGFRERFECQVEGLAFWVAGVCGLLFFLVHRWLIGPLDSLSGFVFLGLFFSVSLFSYQQIQTFSAGHYRKLVSAALMVILGALVFAGMGDSWGVVAFSLGVLWAVRRLRAEEKGGLAVRREGTGKILTFPEWLQSARQTGGPLAMASVTTVDGLRVGKLSKLACDFQERIEEGRVCLLPNKRIIWFSGVEPLEEREVSLLGTDLITDYRGSVLHDRFEGAWTEFLERNFSGGWILQQDEICSEIELRKEFERLFPEGEIFEVGRDGLRAKTRGEMRGIYREALKATRWLPSDKKSQQPKQGVSVLVENGALKWVFVAGRSTDKKLRRWQRMLIWHQTQLLLRPVASAGQPLGEGIPESLLEE